jgi:sugar phosphate isomerase/epimerase
MNQLRTGLVSVTFRPLPPQRVVELARRAKLDAIEWGGDVHVPHGDVARAREVRTMTLDAGLAVAAYGSYYRAGVSEADGLPFERVLESAVQLAAPTVRVWAGNKGSADSSPDDRQRVADDLRRIAGLAVGASVTVSLEYHANTLTDTVESARALLDEVPHPNLLTLWQPPNNQPVEHCVASLRSVLGRLGNVHVFHWTGAQNERRPLAEGEDRWRQYLDVLTRGGTPRFVLMEFVQGDSPEQFLRDAVTLRQWTDAMGKRPS